MEKVEAKRDEGKVVSNEQAKAIPAREKQREKKEVEPKELPVLNFGEKTGQKETAVAAPSNSTPTVMAVVKERETSARTVAVPRSANASGVQTHPVKNKSIEHRET